jgi:hypothetical protein
VSLVIAIVVLIGLPIILMSLEIYLAETDVSYPYLIHIESILLIVFIFYCIKPIIIPPKKYPKIGRLKNLVIEFEFLKRLLYISFPLFLIFMVIFAFTVNPVERDVTYFLFPGFTLIVVGTFLRIMSNIIRKDFRYDHANGCLYLSTASKDQTTRTTYLLEALNSYDKYLRRIVHHQINGISKIYSKILSDSVNSKDEIIKAISAAFESVDKLEPIKYISTYLGEREFLTKEPLAEKVKEWAKLLAVLIPIVISIIKLLLQPPSISMD